MSRTLRYRLQLVVLVTALAALFLASISIGRFMIPLPDAIGAVLGQTDEMSPKVAAILTNSRIPRAAGALLVGMALASSGAAYQSVFANPLATPDIMGATSGAACGAALGLLFLLPDLGVQATAFGSGILAVTLTMVIGRAVGRGQDMTLYLVLVGMVVSALFKSVISITKYVADVDNTLPAITFWLMGSLSGVTKEQLLPVVPIILGSVVALNGLRWKLNLLSFGHDEALAMGLNVKRTRRTVIFFSTLAASAAISLCGLVGWVGILVPHAARLLVGPNYRALMPVATLLGGCYLILVDLIARSALKVEVPLGILTALIGAPFFVYLVFRSGAFTSQSER